MSYKKSQESKSQKPTLRKGLRKHLAQGQFARARDLRKELAQAVTCASNSGKQIVRVAVSLCVSTYVVRKHVRI